VQRAWARLHETGGRAGVGDLAAELRCSRRYLTAAFRAQVGLPPKTVARLLRFADVRRRVQARPARWADIAHGAGYCDQSHLNREFRELAGITPTEFVARQIPGGGIVGEAVPFVQDAAAAAA
jgi:AraC-like DNA-binding protein